MCGLRSIVGCWRNGAFQERECGLKELLAPFFGKDVGPRAWGLAC